MAVDNQGTLSVVEDLFAVMGTARYGAQVQSGAGGAECVTTTRGTVHCATDRYLLRLENPNAPPKCLFTGGFNTSVTEALPVMLLQTLPTVAPGDSVLAPVTVPTLTAQRVTTTDHCPP